MNFRPLVLVSILTLAFPSFAHDTKGPHGGRLTDAGSYHVELVAKDTDVELFVSDSTEKPVASKGFKGLAILVVQGKPQRISLEPSGDDRLKGKATVSIPPDAKGVVQLTGPDGKTAQAKFN
jgi:hypothetical protein